MKTVVVVEILRKRKPGIAIGNKWELFQMAYPTIALAMSAMEPFVEGKWVDKTTHREIDAKPNNELKARQFRIRTLNIAKPSECVSPEAL